MAEGYNREIRNKIVAALQRMDFVYISEAAREAETQRTTARKHLERLTREGIVEEVKKGRLRIFILKKEAVTE